MQQKVPGKICRHCSENIALLMFWWQEPLSVDRVIGDPNTVLRLPKTPRRAQRARRRPVARRPSSSRYWRPNEVVHSRKLTECSTTHGGPVCHIFPERVYSRERFDGGRGHVSEAAPALDVVSPPANKHREMCNHFSSEYTAIM